MDRFIVSLNGTLITFGRIKNKLGLGERHYLQQLFGLHLT
jgi:hypothetical protein